MTLNTLLAPVMALLILWFTYFLWQRLEEFKALGIPVPRPDADYDTSVSVIVPARNEERNIRVCLSALLAQTYPNFEVIAVNNNSTDTTLEIMQEFAADPRVRVVSAPPLPPGWVGKCHSVWTGAQVARGDWLLFVDADSFARPELLAATIDYAEKRKLDVISLLPHQELGTLAERIVQPIVFAVLQIFLPPARANDPGDPLGHVASQCLGIRRQVYEAIDGHNNRAIRTSFAEDAVLGQVVKSAGYRLEIVNGRHLVHNRMYTNFVEIWNGWARVCMPGLGRRWALLPFSLFSSLATFVYFGIALRWGVNGDTPAWVNALNGLALVYLLLFLGVMRWKIGQIVGQPGSVWHVFTYPLGVLVVSGIGFAALVRKVLGISPEWKGQRYQPS